MYVLSIGSPAAFDQKASFYLSRGDWRLPTTCGHSVINAPLASSAHRQVAISNFDETNLSNARKIPVNTTARITIKMMPPGIAEKNAYADAKNNIKQATNQYRSARSPQRFMCHRPAATPPAVMPKMSVKKPSQVGMTSTLPERMTIESPIPARVNRPDTIQKPVMPLLRFISSPNCFPYCGYATYRSVQSETLMSPSSQ